MEIHEVEFIRIHFAIIRFFYYVSLVESQSRGGEKGRARCVCLTPHSAAVKKVQKRTLCSALFLRADTITLSIYLQHVVNPNPALSSVLFHGFHLSRPSS